MSAKPCTCAPSWGSPNVLSSATVIANEAQWHIDNGPANLKPAWEQLRDWANWAKTHNPCNAYPCEYWRQYVQNCRDAVLLVHNQDDATAPACTELNHPD